MMGLILHYILYVLHTVAVEIGQEGVGDFGDPFVPVLVHEVVDDACVGFGEVGIYILWRAAIFHGRD